MIRIGPAGWDYGDWWGVVYPQSVDKNFDPLAYLAHYFEVVEINSTFYRPMSKTLARRWCQRVAFAPDFRFTAKLWQRFTHQRETAFTAQEIQQVREGLEIMAEQGKLGALLMQFPWSFKHEDHNREWLNDLIRELHGFPLVLEVRHSSWNVPEFYEELAERGVGFVNVDQPLFQHSLKPSALATSSVGYIRVHGRNYREWFRKNALSDSRYNYLYTAQELTPWAERALAIAQQEPVHDLYIITNNHFEGKAPTNALMLKSMISGQRVNAPTALVERYQQALAPYVG